MPSSVKAAFFPDPTKEPSLVDDTLVWKATTNSDLVVRRKLQLFQDHFVTYHDFHKDPSNKKTWYLDRGCSVSPRTAEEIITPHKKYVRPSGTWTITATVAGGKVTVLLYLFTITWPTSWATKGYTSFTLGFETPDEARSWFFKISDAITALREKAEKPKPKSRHSHNPSLGVFSFNSMPPLDVISRPTTPNDMTTSSSPEGSKPLEQAHVMHRPELSASTPEHGKSVDGEVASTLSNFEVASTMSESRDFLDDTDESDDARSTRLPRNDVALPGCRWAPYKQANGVAIYYHKSTDNSGVAGEYMVSAVVRGTPKDCLKVLTSKHSNTTVLGPARAVEVLVTDKQQKKDVLRITFEATGVMGMLCAPRQVTVERMTRIDDAGIYTVMFVSLDPSSQAASTSTHGDKSAKSNVESSLPQDAQPSTPTAAKGSCTMDLDPQPSRSFFKRPVQAWVQGVYTVAPLYSQSLDSSPETLVTCTIKVDLKGMLGERSWFKPLFDTTGLTDAFMMRILMSVILLRDEVEHRRFAIQPLHMVAPGFPEFKRMAHASSQSKATCGDNLPGIKNAISRMSMHLANGRSPRMVASSQELADGEFVTPRVSMSQGSESNAPTAMPLEEVRNLCVLERQYWDEIHTPGKDAPFKVRGATYLKDRKKYPAGEPMFRLASHDMIIHTPETMQHVARFLPACRQNGWPFAIIVNLIIPGTPILGIVSTYVTDTHPEALGTPPKHPMEEDHDWSPFEFVLHKYYFGSEQERNYMLKLIPHIADGSWLIKQSVGTTPVILGKTLKTYYHKTKNYLEIDIDITADRVANYVTGLVRGTTKSLVIDMGLVLEGTTPWELPEQLLGTLRLNHLDLSAAKTLDTSQEIPLRPAAPSRTPRPLSSRSRDPSDYSAKSQSSIPLMQADSMPSATTLATQGRIFNQLGSKSLGPHSTTTVLASSGSAPYAAPADVKLTPPASPGQTGLTSHTRTPSATPSTKSMS